jgi:hypothetical protein
MGWNTNLVVARHRTVDHVLGMLPGVYSVGAARARELDFERAASPELAPNIAIGQVDECVAIWDPLGNLADNYDDWLGALSSPHPAVVMKLASVESRYAFHVYDMKQERVRRLWHGATIVETVGRYAGVDIDAATLAPWGCDETHLFALAEQLGIPDTSAFANARYRVVEFG